MDDLVKDEVLQDFVWYAEVENGVVSFGVNQ